MAKEQKHTEAGFVVRATREGGFYKSNRIPKGMTFTLLKASDFSAKWMERAPAGTSDELAALLGPEERTPSQPGQAPARKSNSTGDATSTDSNDVI